MKIALVWGSSTGNTESAAEKIKDALGASLAVCGSIAEIDIASLQGCDVIIAGSSTWNTGELQEDWNDPYDKMSGLNFAGSRLAVFGCGDSSGYAANFVDGMATLYARFIERGASGGYGFIATSGYEFEESLADVGQGQFCGLALDEENQGDQTDARIAAWCTQIKGEFGI